MREQLNDAAQRLDDDGDRHLRRVNDCRCNIVASVRHCVTKLLLLLLGAVDRCAHIRVDAANDVDDGDGGRFTIVVQ